MKIVKILGGLGNQMFQYALYLALKNKFPNEKILVDCTYFKTYHLHTGLELHRVFGLKLPYANYFDLMKVSRPVFSFKLSRVIRKILPPRKTECLEAVDYTFNQHVFDNGDKYYDGYWQNYKYFENCKEVIIEAFSFKIPLNHNSSMILSSLSNSEQESVSIHVRRGDYLKSKNYAGLCGVDYYKRAIQYVNSQLNNPVYFLFSDDMAWSKEYITPMLNGYKVYYVDWNKNENAPLDMLLMSKCKHNIIANSSFSWWAAYLNQNSGAIICAPRKWTNTKVNCQFQLPEWILF